MSTLNVLGRLTFPNSPLGANTQVMIGTPTVPYSSTTGYSMSYGETVTFEYLISALGVKTVNFGSLSSAKFMYIGTDQPITYKVNSGSEVFSLAAGGFRLDVMASVTALEITAGTTDAHVFVMLMGD